MEDPGNKDVPFILNMTKKPLNPKCNGKQPERHLNEPPYIFEIPKYALLEQSFKIQRIHSLSIETPISDEHFTDILTEANA